MRRVRAEQGDRRQGEPAEEGIAQKHAPKTEPTQDRLGREFHGKGAQGGGEGQLPRFEGAETEARL